MSFLLRDAVKIERLAGPHKTEEAKGVRHQASLKEVRDAPSLYSKSLHSGKYRLQRPSSAH
jgi:hypothetical protein